jgi:hypothetical protein
MGISMDKPPQIIPGSLPVPVVSPPYTTNLYTLLSRHDEQEGLGADTDTSTITADLGANKDNTATPKKKKTKTLKDETA